jgi:hypothetical protein
MYLGTSRGSSSTTSTTPCIRVPRHVVRLVTRLFVDYFDYAARPSASACRAARHRLLRLRRASGCLDTSRGSSPGSASTTSPTPRVRLLRHVAQLVARLIVDYFASRKLVVNYLAYAERPGALAHRAARHTARRRLLRLHRTSGSLGTSRGSSSTTSTTPRIWVPRHVVRLVTRLFVDYFDYVVRPGASACRAARQAARRAARRRLLRLRRAFGCLSTSHGSSSGSSSTTSPTTCVRLLQHVERLVA